MKLKKNLSLIFFVYLLCLCFNSLNAQQPRDSLLHYYNVYINAKENIDLVKVYDFFNKHKEISLEQKDTSKVIFDLRILASIEKKFGRFHQSDATAVSALNIIEGLKDSPEKINAKVGILNHLGIISYQLENYDRSIEIYDRILEIEKNPKIINSVYNNKANAYKKKKKYGLSIIEFEKAYRNNLEFGNQLKIARSLDNLGLVKSKLNIENALSDMLEALKIREKEQNVDELFVSYKHLSEYFLDRKNLKRAKFYATKANRIAKTTKNSAYRIEALSMLLNSKNDKEVIAFKKLIDSTNLAKQKNANTFASIQYDYNEERRKADAAELKLTKIQLEEEKQKKFKIIYLATGLFILISSVFLFITLNSRHRKEKLLEIYKTETRISKKVHDEVANDVYQVMTKLQGNFEINENVLDELEEIYLKTREISRENSSIDVQGDFNEILNDLLLSYKNDSVNVITKNISKIDWLKIPIENKTALYRVLQELMTNMKKHSKASIVVLTFEYNQKLNINYSDNGLGCTIKKSVGLQNVENRIKSVKGTITFESKPNHGFKAKIIV